MLEEQVWNEISNKINRYQHTSIQHIEYKDAAKADLLKNDRNGIILLDSSKHPNIVYFATNEIEKMLGEIDCLFHKDIRVNFVPHDFVESFKRHGFTEWAEYADFFNKDIQGTAKSLVLTREPEFLTPIEYDGISHMSKECEKQSRGFTGESAEWFADWEKKNGTIVIKNNHNIIGFCCVSIYANGTILWIREIAVSPKFQGKGLGKRLMEQAIKYGADKGVQRGFLAADVLNKNAIGLYNSYGFYQKDSRSELQMIRYNKMP